MLSFFRVNNIEVMKTSCASRRKSSSAVRVTRNEEGWIPDIRKGSSMEMKDRLTMGALPWRPNV